MLLEYTLEYIPQTKKEYLSYLQSLAFSDERDFDPTKVLFRENYKLLPSDIQNFRFFLKRLIGDNKVGLRAILQLNPSEIEQQYRDTYYKFLHRYADDDLG